MIFFFDKYSPNASTRANQYRGLLSDIVSSLHLYWWNEGQRKRASNSSNNIVDMVCRTKTEMMLQWQIFFIFWTDIKESFRNNPEYDAFGIETLDDLHSRIIRNIFKWCHESGFLILMRSCFFLSLNKKKSYYNSSLISTRNSNHRKSINENL